MVSISGVGGKTSIGVEGTLAVSNDEWCLYRVWEARPALEWKARLLCPMMSGGCAGRVGMTSISSMLINYHLLCIH